MTARNIIVGLAGIAIIVLAALAWIVLGPGPIAFAPGSTVAIGNASFDPSGVPKELASGDVIKRGEYLAHAADCMACHTGKNAAAYAGGFAFNLPLIGTIYSTNITPDKETGIGNYTDAQFLAAVHRGKRLDGQNLYPAMPYASYSAMTDADALAIKAYLFTLPAIQAPARANALNFPFNQRALLTAWNIFFSPDTRFAVNTAQSADWNRGAYLTEALGHCGECHTPRNLMYALDNRQKFSGALTAGWRAYNISADNKSGLGAWSDASLISYLATGHAEGHGGAAGPMGEASDNSLTYLTAGDIHAMVVYLRSVPAAGSNLPHVITVPAPASFREGVTAGLDKRGEKLFAGACASCHDWTGKGQLTTFATLTGARSVNDPSAVNVAQTVMNGIDRKTAVGNVFMPSFGNAYTNAEIAHLANYVTARFGSEGAHLTERAVQSLRDQVAQK